MAEGHDRVLTLVGVFKLFKAALLTALGLIGVFEQQAPLAHKAARLLGWMGALPARHTIVHALQQVASLQHRTARHLGVLSLCYAAIFLIEGVGLLRHKRWAEWLTVIVTASFIPLELYELRAHAGPGKLLALALNVAILAYLIARRVRHRGGATR